MKLSLEKQGETAHDGVYTLYPSGPSQPIKAYCDMTRDGGGWTLLVSSHTHKWTPESVLSHNAAQPSLLKDYSMLKFADSIKDNYLIKSSVFEYRLEAQHAGNSALQKVVFILFCVRIVYDKRYLSCQTQCQKWL